MKLEQSFTVAAPVEQVWEALVDVDRVAPCLPGAQITGRDDEGNYKGTFSVKLGPTTAADVSTDFHITGRLARFGRSGMIEDISRRLMRDFADCLQSSLQAEPPPEAAVAGATDAAAAGGAEAAAGDAP